MCRRDTKAVYELNVNKKKMKREYVHISLSKLLYFKAYMYKRLTKYEKNIKNIKKYKNISRNTKKQHRNKYTSMIE